MKRKITKESQRGFTLVELLLAVSLLTISIGVTSDILMSLIRANNKSQVMNEIEQQSNFVASKIEKELRNAQSATIASGPTLTFTTRDGVEVIYNLNTSTGVLTRKEGSDTYNLTSNASPGGVIVSTSSNCFTVTGNNPTIVSLDMTFTQAQAGPGSSYTGKTTIRSTVVVRNTY